MSAASPKRKAAPIIRVHGRNYMDWFRRNAGRDARYDYLYPLDELKPWEARAKEIAAELDVGSVDVIFNNHYRAQAVVNALQFASLTTAKAAKVPALLAEAYPDAFTDLPRKGRAENAEPVG